MVYLHAPCKADGILFQSQKWTSMDHKAGLGLIKILLNIHTERTTRVRIRSATRNKSRYYEAKSALTDQYPSFDWTVFKMFLHLGKIYQNHCAFKVTLSRLLVLRDGLRERERGDAI